MSHSFRVTGIPAAQGSKRHVGKGVMIESSKKLPAWRRAVKDAAIIAKGSLAPMDGPLTLSVMFYIPKPKSTQFKVRPAGPADLDKLCRAVGDALTDSKIIKDDARFVNIIASKFWAESEEPGVHIRITPAL